jgi:predicted solute-binding protein
LKRLGIIRHRYAQPLFDGLRRSDSESSLSFELVQGAPAQLVLKLLQDEIDGAFLSPLDYAKHSSSLHIVPDVCSVSSGESGIVELHFRDDLTNISSVAINPESSSEVVLARMMLEEKYSLNPKFLPLTDALQTGLKKAESVLLVGNDCNEWKHHTNKLDLVDEWFDVTEQQYVHGFWVTKEGALTESELSHLQKISEPTSENLLPVFYNFHDEAIEGLNEFYRMAYYYGALKDIPDLKFLSLKENS